MKIALVIGHNARAQGAVRVTDRRSEYDWCGLLAAAVLACNPRQYQIVRRPADAPGYTAEINRTYAGLKRNDYAATVELHFNGAAPSASGTETLSSGTAGSLRLARLLQPAMVSALGLRDRGVKTIKRGDRGGESLWAGSPPAALIEPYFGSNATDCAVADRHFAALARAIHEACTAFIKGD